MVVALVALVHGQQENDTSLASMGVKTAFRIYDECYKSNSGFTPCLKRKAITFIDRVSKLNKISLGEEVYVVKVADVEEPVAQPKSLDTSRSAEDQDEALTDMLIDRTAAFLNSRTLQITLPKVNARELGRGMEEGIIMCSLF